MLTVSIQIKIFSCMCLKKCDKMFVYTDNVKKQYFYNKNKTLITYKGVI